MPVLLYFTASSSRPIPCGRDNDPSAVERKLRFWRPKCRLSSHTSTDSHIPGIHGQKLPLVRSIANCIAPGSVDRFRRHTIQIRSLSLREDAALPRPGAARSPIRAKLRAVAAGFRVIIDVRGGECRMQRLLRYCPSGDRCLALAMFTHFSNSDPSICPISWGSRSLEKIYLFGNHCPELAECLQGLWAPAIHFNDSMVDQSDIGVRLLLRNYLYRSFRRSASARTRTGSGVSSGTGIWGQCRILPSTWKCTSGLVQTELGNSIISKVIPSKPICMILCRESRRYWRAATLLRSRAYVFPGEDLGSGCSFAYPPSNVLRPI